jgi:hypothetical protein
MVSRFGEHISVKFDKYITKIFCQPVPVLIKIGLPGCISPSDFPTDISNGFMISLMHATCLNPSYPRLFDHTYSAKGTSYEVPQYAVFSILL